MIIGLTNHKFDILLSTNHNFDIVTWQVSLVPLPNPNNTVSVPIRRVATQVAAIYFNITRVYTVQLLANSDFSRNLISDGRVIRFQRRQKIPSPRRTVLSHTHLPFSRLPTHQRLPLHPQDSFLISICRAVSAVLI